MSAAGGWLGRFDVRWSDGHVLAIGAAASRGLAGRDPARMTRATVDRLDAVEGPFDAAVVAGAFAGLGPSAQLVALAGVRRVLRPGGDVVVAFVPGTSSRHARGLSTRWAHVAFPSAALEEARRELGLPAPAVEDPSTAATQLLLVLRAGFEIVAAHRLRARNLPGAGSALARRLEALGAELATEGLHVHGRRPERAVLDELRAPR